ncbi:major facilitator superfamily domain-containing protein [Mucor mucedo]|uniref:major facilitator superfamily domain-containing protein n=1 Tax=Mucor mucedo TaxID=29922 RepID=UPI002220AD59|nr:major facilitator superfamily domain-containing protein [Mucor mucedo]KAI7888356.1 major facilitator superfamily domain-containing protein [Mucor mucedo]
MKEKYQKDLPDVDTFVDVKAASVSIRSEDESVPPFQKTKAEKRLVKKINMALLPFIGAIVFIQFVDKSTLGISAVLGIIEDTHLTGSQYNWLGSFFYLGFIAFQLPNNYFLQKFPISKYLGTLLILWGIVMACTSMCTNFAQLAACRVLLGLFEAGTYPSLLIIVNTVYRRSEQSAAYGFLWFSNGAGTMLGASCAYGISYMNNARGIETWRWPYIIWGCLTIIFGILSFFFLPDSPNSFMFRLTEEEEKIVEERTRDNAVVRVYEFKRHHIIEALKEPRLYLLCFSTLCNNLHNGGLVVFSTILVKTFGFSDQESILLQIPMGFSAAFFAVLAVFVARKTKQLFLGVVVSSTVSLVGVILLAVLPPSGIKLLGYFLAWAMNGTSVMLLTITGSNVTGYTKKIFYNGMNMIFYTLGNFIGPLVMLAEEAPVYKTGMIIYCIGNGAIIVMIFVNRQIMARKNKIRLNNPSGVIFDVKDDLTDRENHNFIYKL